MFYLSLGGILCAARWAYNRGERRGVATVATLGGAATLRGGTTLGCGVTLGGGVAAAGERGGNTRGVFFHYGGACETSPRCCGHDMNTFWGRCGVRIGGLIGPGGGGAEVVVMRPSTARVVVRRGDRHSGVVGGDWGIGNVVGGASICIM